MARGNWGNSDQHRRAGMMSSGNTTRGADRKGGRSKQTSND